MTSHAHRLAGDEYVDSYRSRPFGNPVIEHFRFALENALQHPDSLEFAMGLAAAKLAMGGILKATGATFADLMKVRELDKSEIPWISNAPYPRRHFHVETRDGHTSLVQVGGFFAPGLVFCKTHGSCEPCECSSRVRFSGILDEERSLRLVEDAE